MKKYDLCGKWNAYKETDENHVYKVNVPGSWNQTHGLEDYSGYLIYEKTFTVEDADVNKNIELRFGGIYRESEIYLNGEMLCAHSGYQAPFHVNITGKIVRGENILRVRVSNEDSHPELSNADLFKINPLRISGIYEGVVLEAYDNIRIISVYTPISIENNEAYAVISCRCFENVSDGTIKASFRLNSETVYEKEFPFSSEKGESEITLKMPLDVFRLWSPESPALYDVEIRIVYGEHVEIHASKTGFKELNAIGNEFYLNGNPYYLLGYGDDFVYPLGVPDAMDKHFYFHGIERAKAYGFNYVRHHSHYPFECYLDAADELGLLVQPELFLANVPREKLSDDNKNIFIDEWKNLIKAYRHHPSIAFHCGGNEMEWGYCFEKELYDIEKMLDPFRLTANTDGNFSACDVSKYSEFSSICPAEYTDYLPWREMKEMFTRDDSGKPQIVHEMGNYATMPDLRDRDKYKNAAVRHSKIDDLYAYVNKESLGVDYCKAFENSLNLQKLCHKLNIEKARLSPFFAGYHVWTLTDYYSSTQGILNPFYEDKAFKAEEFSSFNRQCVLLWDTDSVTFPAGELVSFNIKLSRYGSDDEMKGVLKIKTSFGEEYCAEKVFSGHGIMDCAEISFKIPFCTKESKFKLEAVFTTGNTEIRNSWDFYAIPEVTLNNHREIFIHYLSRHIVENAGVPFRYFTIPQPIGEEQLIVTDYVYDSMLDAVENGANMLLLARDSTFRDTVKYNSFKSPWWDIGEIWYLNHTNNKQVAGVLEDHPALDMLPCKGSWELDLFDAMEMAPSIDLEKTGLNADPILYGTDLFLKKYAYLFEFRLGNGKVLVCTFNHQMDTPGISLRYILKSLVNYCMSEEFNPDAVNTREAVNKAMN